MALMIVVHSMDERVSFADHAVWKKAEQVAALDALAALALQSSPILAKPVQHIYETLMLTALRIDGLNTNVMLVNVHIESPPHFFVAAVCFDEKCIVLINSLPTCPNDIQPVIRSLFTLVAACYTSAGLKFDDTNFKVFEENNCAVQVGLTDCGLFAIVSILRIVQKKPFYTSEDVPKSDHLRAWVLSCLTHRSVEKPVQLRTWKKAKRMRLPRGEREQLIAALSNVEIHVHTPEFKSTADIIRKSIKGPSFKDGKCSNSKCSGENGHNSKSIMCAYCRSWFHVGACVPSTSVQDQFYICFSCVAFKL